MRGVAGETGGKGDGAGDLDEGVQSARKAEPDTETG